MNKLLFYVIVLLLFGCSARAQSFFKPLDPLQVPRLYRNAAGRDSFLNAIRPITNIAAYAEPGNILMAGAGVSYQHLKWDFVNGRWNCIWSVSAMGWAGGSVAPQTAAQVASYGVMLGLFNNLLMVGPALNGDKVIAVVGLGINLNN